MNVPIITCLTVAVLVLAASSARADEFKGSVRIRIVRLEGVPESIEGRAVSVAAFIGNKKLYKTPAARAGTAGWNKNLRAYTAKASPLRFRVVGSGYTPVSSPPAVADAPKPPRPSRAATDEDVVSTGFDEIVGDWTDEPGRKSPEPRAMSRNPPRRPATPVAAASKEQRTICTAVLPWPPADGEHRLECGAMSLLVETRRVE